MSVVHTEPESRNFNNEGFLRELDECRESCWTSAFVDDELVYKNYRSMTNDNIITR